MKNLSDRVAIIGMGCTKFGEHWDKSEEDLIVEAAYEAFEDAGVEPGRVSQVGELAVQHPLTVAEDTIRVVECIMVSECVIIIAMSSSSLARALSLVGIGLLTELGTPGVAPAADPSVVNEVQDLLQISADQRRSLAQGEVVSFPITENTDRELAVGLAMLVSAPLGRIVDYLASGQLIARDSTISEYGRMPDEVSSGAQAGTRFTSGERAEAARCNGWVLVRLIQ